MADPISRPVLTLPEVEAEALRAAYGAAGIILEYGSGGSTVVAGERAAGTVFSVESDADWLAGLQGWFDQNPPASRVQLHHGHIGPTRQWGKPQNRDHVRRWPSYAISVWDRPDFIAPDLVLVDGRFRLACMLTTLFRIAKPTEMLVDDYIDRPGYHRIETLAGAPLMLGRMAHFTLTPQPFPVDQMGWIIPSFTDPA